MLFQAMGHKGILAGICSKVWAGTDALSLKSFVLTAADSASKMLHTTHCAGRCRYQVRKKLATSVCCVVEMEFVKQRGTAAV